MGLCPLSFNLGKAKQKTLIYLNFFNHIKKCINNLYNKDNDEIKKIIAKELQTYQTFFICSVNQLFKLDFQQIN